MNNLEKLIWENSFSLQKTDKMYENVGQIVLQIIDKAEIEQHITEENIKGLIEIVRGIPDALGNKIRHVHIGGRRLGRTGPSEICIDSEYYYHLPDVPGIFKLQEIPFTPGLEARAFDMLKKKLSKMRYKGPSVIRAEKTTPRYFRQGTVAFVIERPEVEGEYIEQADLDHKTQEEMEEIIDAIAESIKSRWINRFDIYGRIIGATKWAEMLVKEYEGIEFKGVRVSTGIKYTNSNSIKDIHIFCDFTYIGNKFNRDNFSCSAHDWDSFKKCAYSHRKNYETIKAKGSVAEARQVDKILANAIRGKMAEYGKSFYEEITSLIYKGVSIQPKNPIKRKISSFYMQNGVLKGNVTFRKGIRYKSERLYVEDLTLPDTMMTALVGRDLTDVIEHPYLEGVKIKKVSRQGRLIFFNPDKNHESLARLIEELEQYRDNS